jgi:hypothetical protein
MHFFEFLMFHTIILNDHVTENIIEWVCMPVPCNSSHWRELWRARVKDVLFTCLILSCCHACHAPCSIRFTTEMQFFYKSPIFRYLGLTQSRKGCKVLWFCLTKRGFNLTGRDWLEKRFARFVVWGAALTKRFFYLKLHSKLYRNSNYLTSAFLFSSFPLVDPVSSRFTIGRFLVRIYQSNSRKLYSESSVLND